MQLFMPQEAATRFGQLVWLLLLGFYVLCLTLIIMLSRPRLVVYNISPEELRPILDAAARRIDPEAVWAGKTVEPAAVRVHLHVESFPPLGNVALLATSDDQSASGWRRLEAALRETLARNARRRRTARLLDAAVRRADAVGAGLLGGRRSADDRPGNRADAAPVEQVTGCTASAAGD